MNAFPEGKNEFIVSDDRVIKRITFRNFVSGVLDAFNITRGGVYSIKLLLLNPGKLVRDYIGLKRYQIVAPFKVLIVSTTIILLLLNSIDLFHAYLNDALIVKGEAQDEIKAKVIQNLTKYFNLVLWTYIPISAFFSFMFNRKSQYNYAENLVFQTYVLSLTNIVAIICFPVHIFSLSAMFLAYQFVAVFYMIYTYRRFFGKSWMRSIIENMTIFVIGSIIWSLLLALSVVGIAMLVTHT